eukprot:UN28402
MEVRGKSMYHLVNRINNTAVDLQRVEPRLSPIEYDLENPVKRNKYFANARKILVAQHKNTNMRYSSYAIFDDHFIRCHPKSVFRFKRKYVPFTS